MQEHSERPGGAARRRVGRYAKLSLLVAAAVGVAGHLMRQGNLAPVAGGFVAAMGEAALIGGLADWYAVRALFGTPLGVPWHTAIIPRNKDRIIRELRVLLFDHWLPPSVFAERVAQRDLVGGAVRWLRDPGSRDLLLRSLVESLAHGITPREAAAALSGPLAAGTRRLQAGPLLADVIDRARRESWLDPLARLLLRRLGDWARSPRCAESIHGGLRRAWERYKGERFLRQALGRLGELLGAVDLDSLSRKLQEEIAGFVTRQGESGRDVLVVLDRTLGDLAERLRHDPAFADRVQQVLEGGADAELYASLLEPVLEALWSDLLADVRGPSSRVVERAAEQLERALDRLSRDPAARQRANDWLRSRLTALIERNHAVLGDVVERRLREVSDRRLVTMIEDRVGDDLNWIRINGACVGGLIGLTLHALLRGAGLT